MDTYLSIAGAEKASPMRSIDANSDIRFSECGQHILFSEPQEQRWMKQPIPVRFIQVLQTTIRLKPVLNKSDGASWVKGRSWITPSPSPHRRANSPNSLCVQQNQGQLSNLRAVRSASDIVLLQGRKDGRGVHESQEFTRLPEWAGEGKANIALKTPMDGDEKIKLILNKAAKPWQGMADPVDQHLPAYVERDQKFLNPRLLDSRLDDSAQTDTPVDHDHATIVKVPNQVGVGSDASELATEFLACWWSTADSDKREIDALLPRDSAVERLVQWMERKSRSRYDKMSDTVVEHLLAAGKSSSDLNVRVTARAILDYRTATSETKG